MDGFTFAPGVRVRVRSPLLPECRMLIAEGHAAMLETYAPDQVIPLTPADLAARNVTFLLAERADRPAGCVALIDAFDHGVVKRLHVRPEMRGNGVGGALMRAAEAQARDIGLPVIRLETGPELAAAVRLYRALGYAPCPAFGAYPDTPCNLFLEKRLI